MKEFQIEGMTLKDFLLMSKDRPSAVLAVLEQAPGAVLNGRPVKKINSRPEDTHQDGARAMVIGSMGPVNGLYGYFVFWNDMPEAVPCFIRGDRIEEIPREHAGQPKGNTGWCDAPNCWCAYPNLMPGLAEEDIIKRAEKKR